MAARHKQIAKALHDNMFVDQPLTKAKLLVEKGGYPATTVNSKVDSIITHPAVKQAMEENGFTVEAAKGVVTQIMFNSESDVARLKATDQVFKVLGTYAAERVVSLNLDVPMAKDEKVEAYVKEFEEGLRGKLLE